MKCLGLWVEGFESGEFCASGNQKVEHPEDTDTLGRPLKYSIFSLTALIRDPIYQYFSIGFRGQPSTFSSGFLVQNLDFAYLAL